MLLENHWQEDKFQSCGEIESMHEFEFVGLVNSDFMNFKRCTGYKLAHLFH